MEAIHNDLERENKALRMEVIRAINDFQHFTGLVVTSFDIENKNDRDGHVHCTNVTPHYDSKL